MQMLPYSLKVCSIYIFTPTRQMQCLASQSHEGIMRADREGARDAVLVHTLVVLRFD